MHVFLSLSSSSSSLLLQFIYFVRVAFVCFVCTVCAVAYQFRGAGKHETHARASYAAPAAAAAAFVLHAARHRSGSDPNEAGDEAAAEAEQS